MTRIITGISLAITLASFAYLDRLAQHSIANNVLKVALCITFVLCIVGLSASAYGVARGDFRQ